MIPIIKKETPSILLEKQKIASERKLNSEEAYKLLNSSEKAIILEQLMEEQGHCCAYCMRPIPDSRPKTADIHPVTIEHWFPQNPPSHEERGQGLDYGNMLAVCSGNRGPKHTRKSRDLTCDAKRKDSYRQLILNPCDPSSLEKIQYKENGEMFSEDPEVQYDISVQLNLNCVSPDVQLPDARRKMLEALQEEIFFQTDEDELSLCTEILKDLESETDPKTEYSGILIWWLKDYIHHDKNT